MLFTYNTVIESWINIKLSWVGQSDLNNFNHSTWNVATSDNVLKLLTTVSYSIFSTPVFQCRGGDAFPQSPLLLLFILQLPLFMKIWNLNVQWMFCLYRNARKHFGGSICKNWSECFTYWQVCTFLFIFVYW